MERNQRLLPKAARITCLGAAAALALIATGANAQIGDYTAPGGYGVKIYRVESALYPFVQVYFRTFDQNQMPLVNLNEMNIGVMVKGRSYDPMKRQYFVQPIRQRPEATRTVLVLDASKSMAGAPFESALRAAVRYIDGKRPQDEVAILASRGTKEGYELVSNFERDPGALGRRLADVRADANQTRLYDSVGAAMQLCGMSPQGSTAPSAGNYVVSCSIVVLSDGQDDGSALSREELNGRITALSIPIPVYSIAYSKVSTEHFKNLEAISKNSFGKYYPVGEAYDRMTRVVEEIQNIGQGDYVVTLRSYVPVDGEQHAFKLGLDYPTRSGKYTYDQARFEAIEPPPLPEILEQVQRLSATLPPLPDANPYFGSPATAPAGMLQPGMAPAGMLQPGMAPAGMLQPGMAPAGMTQPGMAQ
jgi:Mg-chelatase subunit ChlD